MWLDRRVRRRMRMLVGRSERQRMLHGCVRCWSRRRVRRRRCRVRPRRTVQRLPRALVQAAAPAVRRNAMTWSSARTASATRWHADTIVVEAQSAPTFSRARRCSDDQRDRDETTKARPDASTATQCLITSRDVIQGVRDDGPTSRRELMSMPGGGAVAAAPAPARRTASLDPEPGSLYVERRRSRATESTRRSTPKAVARRAA